jgi:hypothetical protein
MSNIQEDLGSFTAARDRRRHSRRTTSLTFVELGDSNGGIVLNISEGGLAMTAAAVLVGERLPRIRFQLPEYVHWLETSGRIVWLSGSKKEAGIQFDDLAEEDGNQIKQWISSRASDCEIEGPTRVIRKSGEPIEFPPPSATVKVIPELEMVEDIEQWQFEDLFPPENVPRHETQAPSAFPVRPPSTQADGHTDDSLPAMARQSRNDRVDPGSVHRNKLRPSAWDRLLAATAERLLAKLSAAAAVARPLPDAWARASKNKILISANTGRAIVSLAGHKMKSAFYAGASLARIRLARHRTNFLASFLSLIRQWSLRRTKIWNVKISFKWPEFVTSCLQWLRGPSYPRQGRHPLLNPLRMGPHSDSSLRGPASRSSERRPQPQASHLQGLRDLERPLRLTTSILHWLRQPTRSVRGRQAARSPRTRIT